MIENSTNFLLLINTINFDNFGWNAHVLIQSSFYINNLEIKYINKYLNKIKNNFKLLSELIW